MLAPPLLACLAQETERLRELDELLALEAEALLQRAAPSVLASFTERKLVLFEALEALGQQRNEHLGQHNLEPGHAGTEAAVARHPELAASWQELLQLAEAAREQNERNGIYIQTQLKFSTEAMAALREAQARTTLYGPKGRQTPAQPNSPTRSHRA